jgi:isopropylmalate/homocitrate/citramalate synthase
MIKKVILRSSGGKDIMKNNRFEFHDVTLREGEQSAGVAFTTDEKVQIAFQNVNLGITSLQIGFPSFSKFEEESARSIVDAMNKTNKNVSLHCLCEPKISDFELACDIGVPWIAFSIPVSDAHLISYGIKDINQLYLWLSEVIKAAKDRNLCLRVSCEDISSGLKERVIDIYKLCAEKGADMITVADTTGKMLPSQVSEWVHLLKREIGLPISVHCHNDFGLATANTLAAYEAGAYQLQTTMCGIGERAGLAATEEVAVALYSLYHERIDLDLKRITSISEKIYQFCGISRPVHKAIVGSNAFAQEFGQHIEAITNVTENLYTPFPPELVGSNTRLVYGKHSSKASLQYMLSEMNISLSETQLECLLNDIRSYALKKKNIDEHLIKTLITETIGEIYGS